MNKYLIVVNASFVRDSQMVKKADAVCDNEWYDVSGELVIGIYFAPTKEQALINAEMDGYDRSITDAYRLA